MVICTPGDGNFVSLDPDLQNPAGLIHNPTSYGARRGSMVITHDLHHCDTSVAYSCAASPVITVPPGDAPLPWFGGKFEGVGDVVAVAPALADGGASR